MNKIIFIILLALSGFALSSCGERWQQASCKVAGIQPGDKDYQACMAADDVDNFAKCRSYGAVPGTDAYVNCMATLAAQSNNQSGPQIPQTAINNPAVNSAQHLQNFISR